MRETLLSILTDCCPNVDFEHETALLDDGLLASLDIVMIATDIMHRFGITLSADDLLPENFNSVDGMLALIRSRQS